jgi:phage regulator Rha-like protein
VIEFKIALVKEFFRMRDELGRREKSLWQQMHALIAREVESKVRASFGSHLMLERKREIPRFDEERLLLESQIQPSLLTH